MREKKGIKLLHCESQGLPRETIKEGMISHMREYTMPLQYAARAYDHNKWRVRTGEITKCMHIWT